MSAESLEGYQQRRGTTPTRAKYTTTASGMKRTSSNLTNGKKANGNGERERWK
jgi:hypothetical protein